MRTEEINRLKLLNQAVLKIDNEQNLFRTQNMYCLTKSGKQVLYIGPDQIEEKLDTLMETVFTLCQRSEAGEMLIKSLAIFWLGFIEIHPFTDGNERTAKEYIKHKLSIADLPVISMRPLERIKISGDVREDLPLVEQALFECVYR
ncbi:MAG: hypothetical protein CME62_13145 [Halobacteriovoraceae bacterium]|nr:hypothetical protein [Halobacteriovoraceae bacterium]|tara:strand:+ start:11939 stop:12376 length:438 start_codon:yes stop_codon:yes gene_type:complete